MYEIRQKDKLFHIYDTVNNLDVAYTKQRRKANQMVSKLKKFGFEGDIPKFFLIKKINLDKKLPSV
jgi:hypothetical protein